LTACIFGRFAQRLTGRQKIQPTAWQNNVRSIE
jgi:hypothetical protein